MRDIEEYARKYHNEPGEYYQALFRKKLVIDVMKKYPHQRILEIGCGLDPLFMHIDDFKKVTVVEPSEDFISNARNLSRGDGRIELIQDFFEQCVEDGSVKKQEHDYIVCSSLIHELEEPQKILSSIKLLCSKDTVVHINVPNAKSIHRLLAVEMGLIDSIYQLSEQQLQMQRHQVYDMEKLVNLVNKNGFEILESGSYFPKFLSGRQMDELLAQGIINEKLFDGLYGLGKYLKDYGSEIYVNVRLK